MHLFLSALPAVAPFYSNTDSESGSVHCTTPLLNVIASQEKWSPLTALVWQKPTIAASVQWIALPAFTAGEDEISVSTSHHSGLLPQKSKFNSSQRKISGQKNKDRHWLQIHHHHPPPQTLIQKQHTLLSLQDNYLQGTPTTKVTEELSWC